MSGAPISRPPSTYVPGRVYACTFDEYTGLALRDRIGMGQLMFETDYPHTDSTWPDSKAVAQRMVTAPDWTSRRPGRCCGVTPSSVTGWPASASWPEIDAG
jgi:hypothetical protein